MIYAFTETPLTERMRQVCETSLPIDKDATIKKIIEEEYRAKLPVLDRVIRGETTLKQYVEAFVAENMTLGLFRKWKLGKRPSEEFEKTVELLFQPGDTMTSRITFYHPICDKPLLFPGFFYAVLFAGLGCILTSTQFQNGIFSWWPTIISLICTVFVIFGLNEPFVTKIDCAKDLLCMAENLDTWIERLYK